MLSVYHGAGTLLSTGKTTKNEAQNHCHREADNISMAINKKIRLTWKVNSRRRSVMATEEGQGVTVDAKVGIVMWW